MVDSVLYCDQCGQMVQVSQIKSGRAIATGKLTLCPSCVEGLPPEEKAALLAMAARPAPARPSARLRRTPPPQAPAAGRSRLMWVLAAAGVAAGAAVGVAVVLLVASPGSPPKAPPQVLPLQAVPSPAGPAAPPETQAAPGAPRIDPRIVKAQLAALREWLDPTLGRYDEIRSALLKLRDGLAGTPEVQEVEKFLAELDGRYAELAEEALRTALAASEELVGKGRFDEASSVLNALRGRFGGSEWFQTRGEKEIDAAVARIAEVRASRPGRIGENVFPEGSFDIVDGRGVPSGWSVPPEWVASDGANRWLRLSNEDPKSAPNTIYRLPVDPAWAKLKVSVRLRAKNLKPGKEGWHTGRVGLRFEDANNQMVGSYGPVPELKGDSDWVVKEVTMNVPAGAHHLNIQPGIFHATGIVEFDDIRVVPIELARTPAPRQPVAAEKRPEPPPVPSPEPEPPEDPWQLFLVEFVAAARSGPEEAKALLDREGQRLAELGKSERLARLKFHLREAELVEELALDGLKDAKKTVRFQRQGRPFSGRVVKVEKGVLSLKPAVGEPVDIPVREIPPEDLIQASELLRLGAVEAVRIGSYFLGRGQIEPARRLVASEMGPKALALREELEEFAAALKRAEERQRRAAAAPPAATEQRPAETTAAFILRVNCGPNQYEVEGWQRDDPWVKGGADFTFGGIPDTTGVALAAPADVYRTCRHQNHSYNFSEVPDGEYIVRLHFYDEHGQGRRMNYTIEGVRVLEGFSTRSREVVVREFAVKVSDGNGLQIVAEQGDGNDAFECGIEIISVGALKGVSGWSVSENFDGKPDGVKLSGWALAPDWRIERGRLIAEGGATSFTAPLAPNGKTVEIEVTLTVESTLPQGGHRLAGPAIYLDDRNFWGMALVEAPDGKRYIELMEMLDGSWVAQAKDPHKLSVVTQQGLAWEPLRPYRLRLEMDPDGITGTFSELGGARSAVIKYRFDNRAVNTGRPALRSGGFRAVFDDFSARLQAEGAAAIAPPPTPPLPGGPKEPLPGETGQPGQWASGLICELFSDHRLRNRIGVRIDRCIDFNVGDAPVDLDGPMDNFAVRWTGFLLAPQDGEYTIKVDVDDEARVLLDGRLLLAVKRGQPNQKTLTLAKGLHPISVTMVEYGGGASCRMSWQTPLSGKSQTIPEGYFYHQVPELGEMGPFAKLVGGLWAEYYASDAFDRKLAEGPIDRLDFDLGELPPYVAQPKDRSALRMRGYLLSRWSKNVKFETEGGGVRLRLDGRTVIDSLKFSRKVSGTVDITVGYHEFELEYVDLGDAKLAVRWEVDGMRSVDANLLFHRPRARQTVDRSGLAPALLGRLYAGENPSGKAAAEFFEPSCWFDWSGRDPAAGVPRNRFSGAWRGMLIAPQSGQYAFLVRHNGGVVLSVGGAAVVNKWSAVKGVQTGTATLRAGKVPFVLTYFNREGDATLDVWWSGPGFGFRRLGAESLAHQAQELPMAKVWWSEPAPAPAAGAAPAAEKERPAETMPAGNLVVNGSFEDMSEDGRFAARWTAHQWGRGGAAYSVRIDRGNAHEGERALLVQAMEDGALPGAFTGLSAALPPGSYTLRFWACADIGKTAQVHANVAGKDVGSFQVGEDWKELTARFELQEKKLGATLRLWSSTAKVKVWFDEVSLEATR